MTAAAERVDLAALRVEGQDDDRYYRYPPTGELFTSVTTITGGTSAKPWLTKWAAKLAALYVAGNIDELCALIVSCKREKAIGLIKDQARLARDFKADVGTYVHDIQEALILWAASPEGTGGDIVLPSMPGHLAGKLYDEDPVEDIADWMITGFLNWVSDFDPAFEATEMAVFNPDMKIAGTLDTAITLTGYSLNAQGLLVPAPGNKLSVCVDTKTGKNLDSGMQEQLAAYRRMPECLLPMGQMAATPATEAGAVLHLRPGYERGYRFMVISRADDAAAWNRFRRATELFTGRQGLAGKPGKPASPLRPDGTIAPRQLADLDGEGYGRAPGALAKAGVADLEHLAALTAADCLALPGIGPKTLPAIRDILTAHGLCLADEQSTPEPTTGEAA